MEIQISKLVYLRFSLILAATFLISMVMYHGWRPKIKSDLLEIVFKSEKYCILIIVNKAENDVESASLPVGLC